MSDSRKLKSTKLWITVWGIGLISYIVIACRTEFLRIAELLCSLPLSYVVANVAQKAIYRKKNDGERNECEN